MDVFHPSLIRKFRVPIVSWELWRRNLIPDQNKSHLLSICGKRHTDPLLSPGIHVSTLRVDFHEFHHIQLHESPVQIFHKKQFPQSENHVYHVSSENLVSSNFFGRRIQDTGLKPTGDPLKGRWTGDKHHTTRIKWARWSTSENASRDLLDWKLSSRISFSVEEKSTK